LREFSLVGLVEGDWDEVDAALDDVLEVEIDWDGDWRVSEALEDQLAILSRGLVGGRLGDVELLIGSIGSRLAGESGHGGDQDVIDEQRETRDWMPRHLRLVPLTDEDGQSVSRDLHVPQFALGPDAEHNGISREVNVEVRRGEDVRIVKSGQEFVDGRNSEALMTGFRVQEARSLFIRLEMAILVLSIELNGFVSRRLAGNKMDSAGQESREIGSFDAATLQSVELQFLGLHGIIKISVKDLRSLQIASFGVINVEIFILCIGEDGGEVLVRSAPSQLDLLHRLLGLLERDRRQRSVTFLQVVDVKSESVPL